MTISDSQTDPGSPGSPGSPGTSVPVDRWGDPIQGPFGQTGEDFDRDKCLIDWNAHIGCFLADEVEPGEPTEDTPSIPAVTIDDLAQFTPDGPRIAGEPDNVGVAGLPTNFVASATVQTVSGTLLGYPIEVRFTPVGYDWDFGDGESESTSEAGRSWESLGQAAFTPTPTSHTYTERGDYTASVDVRYSAEIDLGIGWFPIPGEVTAAGPTQSIRIFEAHTALVAHTCEQAPASPGC
ncbi:PKD domain-containing protein [Microbacterium sp. NPDC055903]